MSLCILCVRSAGGQGRVITGGGGVVCGGAQQGGGGVVDAQGRELVSGGG